RAYAVASTNVAVMADCVCCAAVSWYVVETCCTAALCCTAGRGRTRRDSPHANTTTATTETADTTDRAVSRGITADSRLTTVRSAVASETPLPAFRSWSKTCGPAQRCNDTKT